MPCDPWDGALLNNQPRYQAHASTDAPLPPHRLPAGLKTGLEVLKAEGETRSSSKPKMMVVLGQGPDFERLYAEHPPPPRGAKAGAATAPAEEAPAA